MISISKISSFELVKKIRAAGSLRTKLIITIGDLVRVAPDCNRSYCEDSFSGYSGSV